MATLDYALDYQRCLGAIELLLVRSYVWAAWCEIASGKRIEFLKFTLNFICTMWHSKTTAIDECCHVGHRSACLASTAVGLSCRPRSQTFVVALSVLTSTSAGFPTRQQRQVFQHSINYGRSHPTHAQIINVFRTQKTILSHLSMTSLFRASFLLSTAP